MQYKIYNFDCIAITQKYILFYQNLELQTENKKHLKIYYEMPDKNIPSVEEVTNGVEKVADSYQKNPMGTTIALSVLMLIIGIFFGRHTASTEIESATKRAEESQKVLNQILMGSLEKNQVIRIQKDNIQIKTNENDTLQNKLNQVGEALMIAKPAAVKILNK